MVQHGHSSRPEHCRKVLVRWTARQQCEGGCRRGSIEASHRIESGIPSPESKWMVVTPEHISSDDGDFNDFVELTCRIRVIKDHHSVWYSIGWRKTIGFRRRVCYGLHRTALALDYGRILSWMFVYFLQQKWDGKKF